MTSLIPTPIVDYTDKDFDSLRARLYLLIQSVFPQWTDQNVMAFGNILVELFSFCGDVLTFYQDAQAAESRIVTATQRRSVISLAKLIGFELPGAAAATAEVTLSLKAPTPGDVPFPAGTIVRTRDIVDPIRFQLLSPLTIPGGSDPPEVTGTAEHSENQQDLLVSTGLPDQSFLLDMIPYLDGSLVITNAQGTWSEVENFLESNSTDLHFTVQVDQNDRATVRFGDGTSGVIPTGVATADYKTGGGEDGNVEEGELQIIDGVYQDSFGNPVTVSATNPEKASGGEERMDLETGKILAPLSLRVLNRTVAREDYEINALRVPGVARALMLTSDQDPGIAENTGLLTVIPSGGGNPSEILKDLVEEEVTSVYPNTITFNVFPVDPDYLDIDVDATVYLRKGANAATTRSAILANLESFFAIENEDGTPNVNVDFGFNYKDAAGNPAGEVAFSEIYNVVNDSSGVRKIGDKFEDFLLSGNDRDIALDNRQFPRLGTVTIINGDTGLPL